MTSSFESLVYRVNFLLRIDEAGGKLRERLRSLLCPQIQRERLESLFARNRRFGTTLRAIWQIQVLKLALIERGFDAGFQLVREFTLLQDRRKNRLATCDKIAEVSELLFDVTDLNLVEVSGRLFAIAGDKRYGSALIKQLNNGRKTAHGYVERLADVKQNFGRARFFFGHS